MRCQRTTASERSEKVDQGENREGQPITGQERSVGLLVKISLRGKRGHVNQYEVIEGHSAGGQRRSAKKDR
jgi:hypothetical protein